MTQLITILKFSLPFVIVAATLEALFLALVMRQKDNWRAYFASLADLLGRTIEGNSIRVAGHCYGCTAGQGSSCGGALKEAAE